MTPKATIAPSTITDSAMPTSTNGTVNAGDAEEAAERHDADESERHEPQRAAAELIGENADHDHGELVVEAAERMHEAMHEPARGADASMGESGGRSEAKRKQCLAEEKSLHENPPSFCCKRRKQTDNKPHTMTLPMRHNRSAQFFCDCLVGMQFDASRHT